MPWQIKVVDKRPDKPKIGEAWKVIHDAGHSTWFIWLPNGMMWNPYGLASDGTPWTVTGEMPNITVRPSVFPQPIVRKDGTVYRQGWHGWITNGVISDDLEGRKYEVTNHATD